MFESSPDCLKIMDLDGGLLVMNRNGLCSMEVDDFAVLKGAHWANLWPEATRAEVNASLDAARAGQVAHFVAFCPTAKGTPKWWDVTVSPIRDRSGAVIRLLSASRDVSALRLAEEQLRETAARLRFTLEAAEVGDWDLDLQTDTASRSLRHDQCFGYREAVAEWGFEIFIQHVHPDDRDAVRAKYLEVLRGSGDWHFDCRIIWPDRSVHWIGVHGSLYRTEGGSPTRLLGIVVDITERKRSEEDLRCLAAELSEADRRKTEFLATLAHELRNPLAPIRSGLELISRAGLRPEQMARVRDMLGRQVTHMVRLVDDLLDVARISRGQIRLKKERIDLRPVLASAVETVMPSIRSKQQSLHQQIAPDTLRLDADSTRITQVISNLLNNASKYTPAGGNITLEVRRDASEVVVEVADDGIGIPPQSLAAVFEMFTQLMPHDERAQSGLGIGLTLVRRLVELHGGTVNASSPGVGRGSTFGLRLPLADSDAPRATGPTGAAAPPQGVLKLLVVDDNVDAAESLGTLLEFDGHSVRLAHDGRHALRVAAEFLPDVVFLDIGMPGLNGYETARAMRDMPQLGEPTLVALTGWGTDRDREQAHRAGFAHHLTKPVQLELVESLLAGVSAGLGARRATPAS